MLRELNEIEFFMWTIGQPCNNALSCRFFGDLSPEQLDSALAMAQERHPLLKVTIKVDDQDIPWLTSEGVGPIPVDIIDREGDDQVVCVVEQELNRPFGINTPQESSLPLMRVTWLRPNDNTLEPSDIIFCVHHTVGDGLSQIFLFRDIFQFIANPEQLFTILDVTASQRDILPATIQKKIPRTAAKFKRWLTFLKFFHKLFARSKVSPKTTGLSFKISSAEFPVELTDVLSSYCKREGVTVHSALCTAFSPAFTTISSPINLRDRLSLPVGEAFGCFATGSNVRMKYNAKRTFWDNARNYQKKILKALRDQSLFFIYTLFNKKVVPLPLFRQFWAIFSDFDEPKRLTITNWGALEKLGMYSQMGNFQVKSFFGGVSAGVNAIVLHIFTLNGVMHFHFIYNEFTTPISKIETILSNAMDLLKSALIS